MKTPNESIKALSIIYHKMAAWKSREIQKYGITSAQFNVILQVAEAGELSQNEVVQRLSLDKSAVAKTIGKLESSGYLTRKVNPEDRRAYYLTATPKAMELYPKLLEIGERYNKILTQDMTKEEQGAFSRLLQKAEVQAIHALENQPFSSSP